MASKTLHSSNITFMDTTDDRKLNIYISSNHPTVQIFNTNTNVYTPNWSTTNLQLDAEIYLDLTDVTINNQITIDWYTKIGTTETLVGTGASLIVTTNALAVNPIITYICKAKYQNIEALSQIVFTRTDTGKNGEDGTSVNILDSYDTLADLQSAHPTGNAGDAYLIDGHLYVWSVDNTQWKDVGNIQGPKGADAKNIIVAGDAQVFKVSKTNSVTPATISVTAYTFNTSVNTWTYSVNGGQTFLSTAPTGVVRNGNVVTVTGLTLASNSLVIKASDGTHSDVFTIYKAFDGVDGSNGAQGAPAPIAFLTNENISFSANANGQVATTAFTTNVVAYNGATKVTPTIGEITGLPMGMTVGTPVVTANEQILTFSIANNSTLGAVTSNSGTITIPITSPVSTNLKLSWSKINTGAAGAAASIVDITPSALYFKSAMGKDGVFAPDYVYLYPRFQSVAYSSWQYSVDGGTTWVNASGANGLTIDTYNSVANSLRISKDSTLYTDVITSISFRCNSNNSSVYDIVSIVKIYDIVDLQVGGRNLARFTDSEYWSNYGSATTQVSFSEGTRSTRIKAQCTTTDSSSSAYFGVQQMPQARLMKLNPNQEYTLSFLVRGNVSNINYTYLMNSGSTNTPIYISNAPSISETEFTKITQTFTTTSSVATSTGSYLMLCYLGAKDPTMWFELEEVQLEAGNVATDWGKAPEDLIEEASNVNVMLSNESHLFEANAGGIPTATSVTLDVVGYKGSILSETTVGTITGLPSAGMTAVVSNNGTTTTTIKISVTTSLTSAIADYGVLTIPIVVNGKTVNKKFSWSKAKAGATGATGAAGADAYTVLLTNESHVFAGSTSTALASTAATQVLAYKGSSQQSVTIVSVNGVAATTTATATGITGLTFACSSLTGTSPTITFTCTTAFVSPSGTIPIVMSVGGITFTKLFAYSIAFKGTPGTAGAAGAASSSYWLISNADTVQKTSNADILCTPATLTFTGKSKTGSSAPIDYAARWIISSSTDGIVYTDEYTSAANETSASLVTSPSYKAVRARMYLAGGVTTLLDEQIIPFVSDGAVGASGDDAVTFQVYSSNGYALSTNTPTITLQTFAYVGDVAITSGATYQWYAYNDEWSAISGATLSYLDISRTDVLFSKSYMCKMIFGGVEYTGVATVDDKNDTNKVFTSKPSNYTVGDLWIVGTDYIPSGVEIGTLLRTEHTNATYSDSDWITATKYDEKIDVLNKSVDKYDKYFSFDSENGLKISARDANGNLSQFSTTLSNDRLSFNQGTDAVAYIESNKMKIKEAEIVSPLTVTGQYSGSTMLQAPIINIGNFSIVIESNGSLSIVANT